jgi:hypothetical protein
MNAQTVEPEPIERGRNWGAKKAKTTSVQRELDKINVKIQMLEGRVDFLDTDTRVEERQAELAADHTRVEERQAELAADLVKLREQVGVLDTDTRVEDKQAELATDLVELRDSVEKISGEWDMWRTTQAHATALGLGGVDSPTSPPQPPQPPQPRQPYAHQAHTPEGGGAVPSPLTAQAQRTNFAEDLTERLDGVAEANDLKELAELDSEMGATSGIDDEPRAEAPRPPPPPTGYRAFSAATRVSALDGRVIKGGVMGGGKKIKSKRRKSKRKSKRKKSKKKKSSKRKR